MIRKLMNCDTRKEIKNNIASMLGPIEIFEENMVAIRRATKIRSDMIHCGPPCNLSEDRALLFFTLHKKTIYQLELKFTLPYSESYPKLCSRNQLFVISDPITYAVAYQPFDLVRKKRFTGLKFPRAKEAVNIDAREVMFLKRIAEQGRLTQTEEDINVLKNLSVERIVEIQKLHSVDQQLHSDSVYLYNGAKTEFENLGTRLTNLEQRMSGIENCRLTQTEEDINVLKNLSVERIVEIQKLHSVDQQLHSDSVYLYNGAKTEFENLGTRLTNLEQRMSGIENCLHKL
ncbi:hypothetical protein BC833DRAFT_570138 [Globomyces pollinis-pini]|nr:hypothetical protein BC833DRAFT_570138 [Globomyces pollinis-pini]